MRRPISTSKFEFLEDFRQRTLYDLENIRAIPNRFEFNSSADAREKYVDFYTLLCCLFVVVNEWSLGHP